MFNNGSFLENLRNSEINHILVLSPGEISFYKCRYVEVPLSIRVLSILIVLIAPINI